MWGRSSSLATPSTGTLYVKSHTSYGFMRTPYAQDSRLTPSYVDDITGRPHLEKYRGEDAIVMQVSALGADAQAPLQRVSIKLFINVI